MQAVNAPVKDWKPAIRHLCKVEPRFAPLVTQHGLPTMAPARDLYGSLGRAIVYQQLSGKAAATILGRVQAALGSPKSFPKASVLVRAEMPVLRGAGLSQAKALALLDLAARVEDGRLDLRKARRLPHAGLIETLTAVRGIGPWSADMFAMFALARPDVFAYGDLGVKKGLQKFLGLRQLPTESVMARHSAAWAPWRSAAGWYMWRVLES